MDLIQQHTNIDQITLKVNDIFYSLQGEGARAGSANIFIRLSGCNLKCYFCDTDFSTFNEMSLYDIYSKISNYKCHNIIWTGGEPALQLNYQIVEYFKNKGYYQAIETNGMFPLPPNLDWITVSPKSNKILPSKVDEIKVIIKHGDILPDFSYLKCRKFISPLNSQSSIDYDNLKYCIQLVLDNPEWEFTTQYHKLLGIK